jgi:hypothetical protein
VYATAQSTHRFVRAKQLLGSDAPDSKNQLWTDELYLSLEMTPAGLCFCNGGVTIVRRPALQNVRDENAVAIQAHGAQHFVQQLAGAADERLPASVFFGAWRLAYDHPVRFRISHAEHGLRSTRVQRATRARCNRLPK